MEPSQRIPIIAEIVGFAADIIGIGTFLIALQSPDHHVGKAVPIMILVVIGYSWFILSWAIAREQFFERFEIVAIVDHPSEGSIVLRLQLRLECSHHRSFCLPRPESTIQKKPFISPD